MNVRTNKGRKPSCYYTILVDLNEFKELLPDNAEMASEVLDFEEEDVEQASSHTRPKAVIKLEEEKELPAKRHPEY